MLIHSVVYPHHIGADPDSDFLFPADPDADSDRFFTLVRIQIQILVSNKRLIP